MPAAPPALDLAFDFAPWRLSGVIYGTLLNDGAAASERARLMRRLGDLIAAHVPELSRTETDDTGQPIAQTGRQLVPRAADNSAPSVPAPRPP